MATIAVLNAAGSTVYIEVASGTGTSGDPYITRAASIATSASSIDGKITACNTGAVVLAAGTAVVGKVSIDQTTPGTTNLVQIGGSLPAGTAAIGKLAANSGVDIGDVDVATLPSTWAVNLSGATFPTLTVGLPTGASTAAKQPALGTAGSASSDVISIQGIASMTPIQVSDNSSSLTVDAPVGTPVFVRLSDGSSAITTLPVSLASVPSHEVTNAGTFAVQESGGALTALQIIDDWDNAASDGVSASGDVAHDTADAGEPVKVGFKATTSISGLTLVAANDRTNGFAGVDGVQITRNHCNLEDIVTGNASNTDGTSTECIAAGGAGVKHYLTRVTLTNTSASNIYVEIKDGSTAKHTIPVPAGGGATIGFDPPLPGTAATAWNYDPSAAATTVYCSMVGFKSKI